MSKVSRDSILDAAIKLAEQRSWEALRLHDVAADLKISLNDIRRYFREKEDLVDAWFDRADYAMLECRNRPGFQHLSTRARIHLLLMTWLDTLAPHHRVTRQMIYGKFEIGHLHIQIPGLMRISRTVQWLREAAGRDQTYLFRALEETALTTIYLMTFFYWMNDDSEGSSCTSKFLDHRLAHAEFLSRCFPCYSNKAGDTKISAG